MTSPQLEAYLFNPTFINVAQTDIDMFKNLIKYVTHFQTTYKLVIRHRVYIYQKDQIRTDQKLKKYRK